jgi:hypothetical protein
MLDSRHFGTVALGFRADRACANASAAESVFGMDAFIVVETDRERPISGAWCASMQHTPTEQETQNALRDGHGGLRIKTKGVVVADHAGHYDHYGSRKLCSASPICGSVSRRGGNGLTRLE